MSIRHQVLHLGPQRTNLGTACPSGLAVVTDMLALILCEGDTCTKFQRFPIFHGQRMISVCYITTDHAHLNTAFHYT